MRKVIRIAYQLFVSLPGFIWMQGRLFATLDWKTVTLVIDMGCISMVDVVVRPSRFGLGALTPLEQFRHGRSPIVNSLWTPKKR